MSRISHEIRRALAMLLAAIPFHRVTSSQQGANLRLRKRRRLSSYVLVPLANAYLRWMGSCSLMLSNRQWHEWEAAIGAAKVTPDEIAVPMYPGKTLASQLTSDLNIDDKMCCYQLALSALLHLHQTQIKWRDQLVVLSHGDATASNVCVDLPTNVATWFDFDTRHRLDIPVAERQADDLRALLYSSAACLAAKDYPWLLENLMAAPSETLTALHGRLPGWSRPNTFQLAQAPLDYASFRTLTEQLDRRLEQM